jgi:hypothetical protein
MLRLRSSEVRVELNFSASDNWITPSLPILLAVLSENEKESSVLLQSSSSLRDVFDLSASDNLVAAAAPISLSALGE